MIQRRFPVCVGVLLLCAACAFAGVSINPTTTLAAQTGNNTSAANSFQALSDGNAGAGNVSKLSIKELIYPGFQGKLLAHYMPWWGGSGHMNIGYSTHDAAQAEREVQDMISRGFDGVLVAESHSGTGDWDNVGTLTLFTAVENHPGFLFVVSENKGGYKSTPSTSQLVAHMKYNYQHYFNSPNYLRWNGRPVVFFFDGPSEISGIDWAAAKAQSVQYGNPIWVFRNNSGYTVTSASDGGFSWMGFPSSGDRYGINYLDSFYSKSLTQPSKASTGSFWKGFNDSLASWGKNRITPQYCGTTWITTLAQAGKYYASSSSQMLGLQVATWNDYEEGTEIETGIDNCGSVSASVSGGTLNFAPSFTSGGSESTVDHYVVYVSKDGQNLMPLTEMPAGARTLNIGSYGLPTGTILYVQMVGKPTIQNKMSNKVVYGSAGSTTTSSSSTSTSTQTQTPTTTPATGGACNAPAANGIVVCSPGDAGTVSTTFTVQAAATLSGGVYRFELWTNGTKLASSGTGVMNQSITLTPGSYQLTFTARNAAGTHVYATRNVSVISGTVATAPVTSSPVTTNSSCAMPTGSGVDICSLQDGATVGTTFPVRAYANVSGGVYRFELWANGTKVFTVRDSGVMNSSMSLAPGAYQLAFVAYNTAGVHVRETTDIVVQ